MFGFVYISKCATTTTTSSSSFTQSSRHASPEDSHTEADSIICLSSNVQDCCANAAPPYQDRRDANKKPSQKSSETTGNRGTAERGTRRESGAGEYVKGNQIDWYNWLTRPSRNPRRSSEK